MSHTMDRVVFIIITFYSMIYIYIYICVCVCVCVCARARTHTSSSKKFYRIRHSITLFLLHDTVSVSGCVLSNRRITDKLERT